MMRRSFTARISNFGFGHPPLNSGFGLVKTGAEPPVRGKIQKSALPNGTRVVTHDRDGAMASVAMFVDGGVKYDPLSAPGLSHVMGSAFLTSNLNSSHFQINRTLHSVGSSWGEVEVNKRWLGWSIELPRYHWATPLEQLSTAIAAPRFWSDDIQRYRDALDAATEETRWRNPRTYALNQLENVAFYKEPLGNPRLVPKECNDLCSSAALLEKYSNFFSPNRVIISAVNVAHEDIVSKYTTCPYQHDSSAPHFIKAVAPTNTNVNEADQYRALNERVDVEDRPSAMLSKPDFIQEGIVAIGWLTEGAEDNIAKYASALVANELLGVAANDGVNFDRSEPHRGIRNFYRPYSTAGLFGFTVREDAGKVEAAVKHAFKAVPTDFVTSLPAAKARAVSTLFTEVEDIRAYSAFLATSKYTVKELAAAIDKVSSAEVGKIFEVAKSKGPVMYATGNIAGLPSIFKLKA